MLSLAIALTLAQTPFVPLNGKPLPPSSNEFTFVALGDNRPAGKGLPPTATFREILREVAIIDPAFVISTGDLLYGNEESLEEYRTEVGLMKPLLNSLPCPFYNAPGNHEINNRLEFLQEYTSTLGPTYGEFDFGGIRFLAVCTELPAPEPSITGDELAWLKTTLSKSAPTVVFEHHPVFVRGTNDEKADAHVADPEAIHKLYLSGGVKMVAEGHDHVYNAQEHDGIAYVIAGGAGAPLDAVPTEGGFFHFLLVKVKDGKFEMSPIPLGGVEVTQLKDGVAAVGNYADVDLPISNLEIPCSKRPTSVTASYSSKKKSTDVDAKLLDVRQTGDGFVARVGLTATKHRATVVKLGS